MSYRKILIILLFSMYVEKVNTNGDKICGNGHGHCQDTILAFTWRVSGKPQTLG
jgi:hypothetical protein